MAKLSAGLYEAISSASLHVYEDRELEAEILGLVVVETPSGWRFDHRRSGYSDRAIALAMALAEAVRLGRLPGGRTFSSFKQGARYPFTSRRRVEEPIVPPAGDALSERVGLPGYVGDQIQAHQPAWRQRQARRARARPGGG